MASSVRNPLLLPEIAQLIATFSGYREQRNLAYTSRRLFRPVIPIIWEEIRGVEILMKLIPGVKIVVKFEAEKYYKEVKVMKHMWMKEHSPRIGPDIGSMPPLLDT
ncbi:hypothetical protein FRC11_010028 [Ceratobasidium sp. 423]|nr:hypothetical protein FRC11_010028 [Ceratobasidium sp. 423]